jgi:hypothetical protein
MPYTLDMLCYRLRSSMGYDPEIIWQYVQRSGGEIQILRDCIDFWVPVRAELLLTIAWPDLERRSDQDLI